MISDSSYVILIIINYACRKKVYHSYLYGKQKLKVKITEMKVAWYLNSAIDITVEAPGVTVESVGAAAAVAEVEAGRVVDV